MTKPTIFISYSHKDEAWKDRLVTHLRGLGHQGSLDAWDDRRIEGGQDWHQEIQDAMSAASVALLLVSADFLASKFIQDEEVPRLLERRESEGVRVIPVILKPCAWQTIDWLKRLQARPKDRRPLSQGDENQIETDLAAIAAEIDALLRRTAPRTDREFIPLDPDRISIHRLPFAGPDLFGREKELVVLDAAWEKGEANVFSLVAWGGVGKTALVRHWLGHMAADHYRGALRVFGWSFYSQSTRETAASADQFVDAALRWFGDPDPTEGSPWDKGERLARLVRAEPTLLVLDGLEPLQYPPGPEEGRLKDPGLATLLRDLAAANSGLCVITTRLSVADIAHLGGTTAPVLDLERLSDAAGAELLRSLDVQGTEAELRVATREFGGHGLALNLVGTFLRDVYEGDVHCLGEVSLLEEDEERGGHARRVMVSYERWLGEGPELAVLRLMGLFDRPADGGSLAALRAGEAIPGLTDALAALPERGWRRALARLRGASLLSELDPHQAETLDAHPLVREHFGEALRAERPNAWREGHNRLFEHLKTTAKEYPDTLEEMAPLYAAVAHGCQAELYKDVYDNVVCKRIRRENEYYSTHRLGAVSADLVALSGFFESPWRILVTELTEENKAAILNWAGFCLRALGRLAEAAQPLQAALEMDNAREDCKSAAVDAGNLSELYVTLGDLAEAVNYARQSVELADRSGDWSERTNKRTTLADALHQAGRLEEAEAAFGEAEVLQKEQQPSYPLLYALQGYRYCDLLLGQGRVRGRAAPGGSDAGMGETAEKEPSRHRPEPPLPGAGPPTASPARRHRRLHTGRVPSGPGGGRLAGGGDPASHSARPAGPGGAAAGHGRSRPGAGRPGRDGDHRRARGDAALRGRLPPGVRPAAPGHGRGGPGPPAPGGSQGDDRGHGLSSAGWGGGGVGATIERAEALKARVAFASVAILSFATTPRRHSLCKKQVEPEHVILNEVKDLDPAMQTAPLIVLETAGAQACHPERSEGSRSCNASHP
jgi:tetratricopeptide (TPR) repeat protein